MSITSGTITCRAYCLAEPPGKNFLDDVAPDLERHAFKPVRVERSPRSLGWVSPRDILDTDLTLDKVLFEDFLVLGFRLDKVTVNARLLKAYCNQERLKYLRDHAGKKQMSRDERATLLEKVRLQLLKLQSPTTSFYEMAWNLRTHQVYFTATSTSLNQEFCDLFSDTFHTALTPLFPFIRADRKAAKEGLADELAATEPAYFSPLPQVREIG